jgi:D-sedoheptulose 7-phosphate isomerase
MNPAETVTAYLRQSAATTTRLADEQAETIARIAQVLIECLQAGGKVLLCGNGGSAADAEHIAGELAGRYLRDRAPLPALALTTNTATLTAIANDYEYAEIFARQVRALAQPGDVVMGLSTSGRSTNILRAMQTARERGAHTIGFTGAQGGALLAAVDLGLRVPATLTPIIQEAHMAAAHVICELVENALFPA